MILTVVLIAAYVHARAGGRGQPLLMDLVRASAMMRRPSAASALIVVFFYWGWDVTSNLAEEAKDAAGTVGEGGFAGIVVTVLYFVAFMVATLFLFSLTRARGLWRQHRLPHRPSPRALGRAGGLSRRRWR